MSDRIITNFTEKDFQMAKQAASKPNGMSNNHGGGSLMRSALLQDKNGLPKNIQRKMASPSVGMGNISMGNPSFYHPVFQNMNIMLPRDRRERNEWCRHFYRTEPIIATSLDLHTEFPISDFNNVVSDDGIKEFFDYMAFERLDLVNLLLDIGLEYWKLGDVFPFGQLNEQDGMWERFVILNPDYVDIKASILAGDPVIELIPDETVKAIIDAGPRGDYSSIYSQFPEDVVRQVRMGRNIRLDNRLVSHIAHKASQYETWGTPIMMRCFKTLIYKDKLREAQNAIASRHVTPLRIFKVGAPGEPMPSQEDLDSLRDTLIQADDDPNFMLVYHYALQTDYVGSAGRILPLNQEFDFIQKELMNGLGINQAMLNGEGPTYSNAQVGMDALARRYMSYRLRLESWIRQKVYRPISEIQGFYKPTNGTVARRYLSSKEQRKLADRKEMQLIVPEISWSQQDLTSNQSVLNFIQQLQSKGLVSMSTILPMLKLDPETERKNLEQERGSVFDTNAPKAPSGGGAPGGPSGGAPKPPTTPDSPGPNNGNKPGGPPTPGGPKGNDAPGKADPSSFGFPGKGAPPENKAPSPNDKSQGDSPAPTPSSAPTPPPVGPKHSSLSDFLAKDGVQKEEKIASMDSRSSVKVRRYQKEDKTEK
ncbi:portal protein [Bacillus phage G]|uniref:Gp14 n=1 Tax=Bacillus phage G TaxID=2884420 RepID=G3MB84_9CAUD|nr:portal protein [Bacillus phage G]AEO93285.1 gp14 [Bacillus phage G]